MTLVGLLPGIAPNTFLLLMCAAGFLQHLRQFGSVGFLTEKSTPRRFLQQHRTHFDTFCLQHAFKRITYVKVHNALFQFTKVTAASPCITQVYQARMTPEGYMLNLRSYNRNALGLIAVYARPDERRLSLHDIL